MCILSPQFSSSLPRPIQNKWNSHYKEETAGARIQFYFYIYYLKVSITLWCPRLEKATYSY